MKRLLAILIVLLAVESADARWRVFRKAVPRPTATAVNC